MPTGGVSESRVPEVWGIVNTTPDSFSDGGQFSDTDAAVAHGRRLAQAGADVLDIGGESTRPGAAPVAPEEEIRRTAPVILALAGIGLPISIDTRHAAVARAGLDAGARIVNDVSAGADPAMLPLVAERGVEVVLMHMRGDPRTMQDDPQYDDVVAAVADVLAARVAAAEATGIPRSKIFADPGIGFGKTLDHNLALIQGLEALRARVPGTRWLLGASRKGFLGTLTGRHTPTERLAASLACVARAADAGVDAVRVHDVAETRDLLTVYTRLRR